MSTIVGQVSGIPQWATGAIAVIAAAACLIRTIYRGHARILSIKTPTSSRDRLELAVFKYERRLQGKTQRRCPECESHSQTSITLNHR
jgi:hypothetical protein